MKLIADNGAELTIEQVRAIDLRGGDVIVIKTADVLTDDAMTNIRRHVEPLFPGNKILVLPEGLDIEILRKKAEQ